MKVSNNPKSLSAPDPHREAKLKAFDRLLTMMDELRENCPWDQKQTFQTLRNLTVEETYELSDAIIENDVEEVRKELGDLMLHLLFYARIASETKAFDITDVLNGVYEKMYRRHPHVYGDTTVANAGDVKKNWETIKQGEGQKSILAGVPRSLPAMVKAIRIQEKARSAGFDWEEKEQVWEKVQEELGEFLAADTAERREEELGDVLFSLINYARFVQIDPELALEKTNRKFIDRFTFLETASKKDGKNLQEMTLEEMDAYWEAAKKR